MLGDPGSLSGPSDDRPSTLPRQAAAACVQEQRMRAPFGQRWASAHQIFFDGLLRHRPHRHDALLIALACQCQYRVLFAFERHEVIDVERQYFRHTRPRGVEQLQ